MSLGRVVSRTLAVALLTLPLLSCSGSWVALLAQPAASQEASKPFVAWARENAIPVVTTEPGQGFDDLQRFKEMIGSARVVGLGESIHAAHEFFKVRHRLTEFLVEEMGFTAVAMETGFAEAVKINEYVLGRREEPDQWKGNWFTWGLGAEQELLALVRWMRRYNEDPTHERKLRFYGIDVPVAYSSPLTAVEGAWAYLDEVDPGYAASSRETLLPLVEPFLGQGGGVRQVSVDKYSRLAEEARNAYAVAIGDLIAWLEIWRVQYIHRSSEEAYEWALRQAVLSRQLDRSYRHRAALPPGFWEALEPGVELPGPRDAGMAENLVWALQREGPKGRIVLWAHNSHLQKYPMVWREPRMTQLGEYFESMVGDEYLSVGFTYSQGAPSGWASYQTEVSKPAPPGSLDAAMAQVGLPMFVLDLRRAPREGPVYEWLNQEREQRESVPEPHLVNPARAWDVLFHIDRISPAVTIEP